MPALNANITFFAIFARVHGVRRQRRQKQMPDRSRTEFGSHLIGSTGRHSAALGHRQCSLAFKLRIDGN